MASVVDWSLDTGALRKQLLQLSKTKLIRICKERNVTYSTNKKETIDRLVNTTGNTSTPRKSSMADRISYYEKKDKKSHSRRQGKETTIFSDHELQSVGLSWLKPPKLNHNLITDEPKDEDKDNEQLQHGDTMNVSMIQPATTKPISYPSPYDYDLNETSLKEELNKKIESYGSFEVMSSLLFGFAVTVAFEKIDLFSYDEVGVNYLFEVIFTILISIVLICNAYTMIVMSLTYFYVHRYMADKEYVMASIYLKIYANYRRYARRSFYIGLVIFIIAIGVYLFPLLNILSKICITVVLGIGLIIIIFTLITMTNPSRMADRNNPGHRKFLSAFIEKGGVHEKTV